MTTTNGRGVGVLARAIPRERGRLREDLRAAFADLARASPYAGLIRPSQQARLCEVALRLLERCPPPARVADLGTGLALFPALLGGMGYEVVGVDDYEDPWHGGGAAERIAGFADAMGFTLSVGKIDDFQPREPLDAVSCIDVIEHLHNSPRPLMNHIGRMLRPGGSCIVAMPNSVNLRKRLAVVRGETNYPALHAFFNAPEPWRGHVREYTPAETGALLRLAGFDAVEVGTVDAFLFDRLGRIGRLAFRGLSAMWPAVKDTVVAVATRPEGWRPVEPDPAAAEAFGEEA